MIEVLLVDALDLRGSDFEFTEDPTVGVFVKVESLERLMQLIKLLQIRNGQNWVKVVTLTATLLAVSVE